MARRPTEESAWPVVSVRFPLEDLVAMARVSKSLGLDRSELIRLCVRNVMSTYPAERAVTEALAERLLREHDQGPDRGVVEAILGEESRRV